MKRLSETQNRERKSKQTLLERVTDFFLNLFKLQLGAAAGAIGEAVLLSRLPYGKDLIYELRVEIQDKLTARRMTIGPLGEATKSKSKCFKVIYDDLLVVKVPPVPITDFDEYIQSIHAERRIVKRLMPEIECIAPSISSLFRKIPMFLEKMPNAPEGHEQKCVELLQESPDLQRHLKIDKSFAFFMGLSKYFFLGHVLEQMHNTRHQLAEEFFHHQDALQDMLVFEEKWGPENAHLFYEIDHAYNRYAKHLHSLTNKHEIRSIIPAYKKKGWFVGHLAEEEIDPYHNEEYPVDFLNDLNSLLRMILADNAEINAYRRLVRDTMRSRTFSQNKAQFEGIITNLLDLLARLNSKGVAIRDLKPDNLFVVGEPARPMSLLANSAEYSIGLIDFETAVEYGKTNNKKRIPQPLLAGTPAYATPANLFPNRVLQSMFSDLSHTLHLQDWFAVVGMCYRVITGETLFRDTGQILPGLIREIKRFSKDKKRLAALFREKSLRFWISAIREYDEKKEQSAFLITSVYPRITKPAAELLKKELMEEYRRCGEGIRKKIGTQGWFRSEKSRKDLLRLSSAGLKRVRENWEKGIGVPKLSIEIRKRIIRFFRDLEADKTAGEDVSDKIRRLGSPDPRLTALELMDLMFDVVRKYMHPDAWEDVAAKARMSPDPTKEPEKAADIEVTDEQTASIEKTLSAGKSKDTDKSRRDD